MTTPQNPADEEKLSIQMIRNRFFYAVYRRASLVFALSLLLMATSVFFFFVAVNKPVIPLYIPVDNEGRMLKGTPLADCSTKMEASVLVSQATRALWSWDYVNLKDQLNPAAEYFHPTGWNSYISEFMGAYDDIIRMDQLISKVDLIAGPAIQSVSTEPIMFNERNIIETCSVQIDMPIKVTLISTVGHNGTSGGTQTFKYVVHAKVVRVPLSMSRAEWAIYQFVLKTT